MFNRHAYRYPLLRDAVPAGFPSPATDYVEDSLSLDEHLVEHQEATFFVRVSGTSMTGFGIHDGDLLVVERRWSQQTGPSSSPWWMDSSW